MCASLPRRPKLLGRHTAVEVTTTRKRKGQKMTARRPVQLPRRYACASFLPIMHRKGALAFALASEYILPTDCHEWSA